MKKFELRPIYYPKGSYLNYILEIWVDGVNISQFCEGDKLRIDVGYIFHIYNYFDKKYGRTLVTLALVGCQS